MDDYYKESKSVDKWLWLKGLMVSPMYSVHVDEKGAILWGGRGEGLTQKIEKKETKLFF